MISHRIIKKPKFTNKIFVNSEARSSFGKLRDRRLLNSMNSYAKIVDRMDVANLRFATSMRSTNQIPAKSQRTHEVRGLLSVPTSTITST